MEQKEIIRVENLVKKFNGFVAVNNISFSVKEGEIFAFLGPNGAGKTTTIRMITTLLNPTSGNLYVNGFDVAKQKEEVRRSFGIVFQDPSLDEELTAEENLDFHGVLYHVPDKIRKERITKFLKFVELWDRRKDLVKKFSGGMKRRLEVARALVHQPKLIFLDEPTIGLDPQTRNKLWNYIREMNKKEKTTIFFTTHYIEEAEKIADTVSIIDNGVIIRQGSPAELKKMVKKNSLEEVFLKLTGKSIREQEASGIENMRLRHRIGRR